MYIYIYICTIVLRILKICRLASVVTSFKLRVLFTLIIPSSCEEQMAKPTKAFRSGIP